MSFPSRRWILLLILGFGAAPAARAFAPINIFDGLPSLADPLDNDPNEYAVGIALDTLRFNSSSSLAADINRLASLTEAEEEATVAQLVPVHEGLLPILPLAASRRSLSAVDRRMAAIRARETPPRSDASPWAVWSGLERSDLQLDEFDSVAGDQVGLSAGVWQADFGAERRIGEDFLYGASFGYSRGHANLTEGLGHFDSTTLLAGVYGTVARRGFHLDGYVGGGRTMFDLRREIPFFSAEAAAQPSGTQIDTRLGGGWDGIWGGLRGGPVAAMEYHRMSVDGFTEAGAGPMDFQIGGQIAKSLASDLGVRAAYPFSLGSIHYAPSLTTSWRHDYWSRDRVVDAAFDGGAGPSFSVVSSGVGADAVDMALRLDAEIDSSWSTFCEADAEIGRTHEWRDSWRFGARLHF